MSCIEGTVCYTNDLCDWLSCVTDYGPGDGGASRIRQVGMNEELTHRAPGFALFTSKQKAKVAKGS